MSEITTSENKKLTKKELNGMFWRIQTMSFSYNYEKLQTIGFAHCMVPVLDKLYEKADQETRIKAMQRHFEFFNTQIESILLKEKLNPNQIHHFAVSTGPGSFTGIRVSGNIAKTLAYSTNKKIWTTDSLSILAEQADGADNVVCCINAFKNMVYVASFKSTKLIDGPSVIKCSNINEYLSKNYLNDKLTIVGDGWEIICNDLNSSAFIPGCPDLIDIFNTQLLY